MLSYEERSNNAYEVRPESASDPVVGVTGDRDLEDLVARGIRSSKKIDKQFRLT